MNSLTMFRIWEHYIVFFILAIVLLFFAYKYLNGFTIFEYDESKRVVHNKHIRKLFRIKRRTNYQKEKLQKLYNNKIARAIEILIFSICFIIVIWYFLKILPDLPNVISNNYETIECITTKNMGKDSKAGSPNKRISCVNNREEIYIEFYDTDDIYIEKDTVIKVNYFRHLEIGYIPSIQD